MSHERFAVEIEEEGMRIFAASPIGGVTETIRRVVARPILPVALHADLVGSVLREIDVGALVVAADFPPAGKKDIALKLIMMRGVRHTQKRAADLQTEFGSSRADEEIIIKGAVGNATHKVKPRTGLQTIAAAAEIHRVIVRNR